jgi:diguanylate cyclase (GGDEF)-like protein
MQNGDSFDLDATRRRNSVSDPSVAENAYLVVLHGPHLGRRFGIGEHVRLGRDRDNDIVLDTPDVSRRHAELRQTGNGWVARDLGSTNGTHVNGTPVESDVRLSANDLLDVGGVIFKMVTGSDVEAVFYEQIYRLSAYDGLTTLHNRRSISELLQRELSRSNRYERPLSIAILDIDHFKQINDVHGHLAGDRLLTAFSSLILKNVRREELIGRWGGEEFAVIFPETPVGGARIACEKLRQIVEREPFAIGSSTHRITMSIGVAGYSMTDTVESLVSRADDCLYRAKNGGRNRVCSEDDLPDVS